MSPLVATELDARITVEDYAQDIREVLPFIIVPSIFSAILLPLLGLLFALSTSRSRWTTIFILNVFAVSLGIVTGVLCIHVATSSILKPAMELDAVENFCYTLLSVWVPWITEAVLLFRVVVVYRPSYTRLFPDMLPLLAFPIAIKIARAIISIIFLVHRRPSSWHANVTTFASAETLDTWSVKVTWVLELVDNLYISFVFLWRLFRYRGVIDGLRNWSVASDDSVSISDRLRTLCWITSTNFVFPLILGVSSVTLLFTGHLRTAKIFKMNDLFVAIICTVLATIWASTSSRHQATSFSTRPIVFNVNGGETSITAADEDRQDKNSVL